MGTAEEKEDKRYSFNDYIRSKWLLPHLNGNQAPSVPETIEENVSPVSEDTVSERQQPLTFDNVNFD